MVSSPAEARPNSRRGRDRGKGLIALGAPPKVDIDVALTGAALLSLPLAFGLGSRMLAVFLLCGAIQLARNPGGAARAVLQGAPLLLIPLVAIASTTWSVYPDLSLKGGLQLLLAFAVALVLTARTDERRYVEAVLWAGLVAGLACFARPITSEGSLVSYLGSKNQVSFLGGLLSLAALSVALTPGARPRLILAAAGAFLLSLALVVEAHSAGGLVEYVLGVPLVIGLSLFGRLKLAHRLIALTIVLLVLAPIAASSSSLQTILDDVVVNTLHKDTTLTGRTYLWYKSVSIIASHPLLGVGYHAFWVQGNADPEGLWAYFYIPNRSGFNFHNEYIDMTIALGRVGEAALILTLAVITLALSWKIVFRPSAATAFFLTFTAMAILRTFTETSLIGEFNLYTQVLLAGGAYALRRTPRPRAQREATAERTARSVLRGRRFMARGPGRQIAARS